MAQQRVKRWLIFCEPCSFKKIVEAQAESPENTGLTEIKESAIPGHIPELDPVTLKTKFHTPLSRAKKFKCPKCGRGVIARQLPEAYVKTYDELDKAEQKRLEEIEKTKRIEDGKPIKRQKDVEFLG